jgi:hypothetical protein
VHRVTFDRCELIDQLTRLLRQLGEDGDARRHARYEALKRNFDEGRIDEEELALRLSDAWATSYREGCTATELVEVDQGELTYLFDIAAQRVLGVYGRAVPPSTPRPAARMRGFPLPPTGDNLVRGHLAAHSIGGGTDINLIPQNAALNLSGAWRRLERLAQLSPGSFVAIEASYDDGSQTPTQLTYLVAVNGTLAFERFSNR